MAEVDLEAVTDAVRAAVRQAADEGTLEYVPLYRDHNEASFLFHLQRDHHRSDQRFRGENSVSGNRDSQVCRVQVGSQGYNCCRNGACLYSF